MTDNPRLEWNDYCIPNGDPSTSSNLILSELPHKEQYTSDQLRHYINIVQENNRNLEKSTDDLMKYAMLAIMIMIPAAIAGVIFLVCIIGV